MKLLDFYASTLEAVGMSVDNEGFVSCNLMEVPTPAMVDGHRLVLPTSVHLNNAGLSDNYIFHPLRDNSVRGPSPVLEYYRKAAMVQLESHFHALAIQLLSICASTEQHKNLSPEQSEILSAVKKVDQTTVESYTKITERIGEDPNLCLIRIFLKKGARLDGKTFKQGAIVSFPLYDQLTKLEHANQKERNISGVALRVMDVKALKAIIEYILPDVATDNAYSRGSNSALSPRFEALLGVIGSVAECLNDKITLMGNLLISLQPIASDWAEYIDRTDDFMTEVRGIPMQRGNEGGEDKLAAQTHSPTEATKRLDEFTQTPQQAAVMNAPAQASSMTHTQSTPTKAPLVSDKTPPASVQSNTPSRTGGPKPISEFFQPAPVQQPPMQPGMGMMQPGMQPGMMYPQQMAYQPGMQPMGMMQAPMGMMQPQPMMGGMPPPMPQGQSVMVGGPAPMQPGFPPPMMPTPQGFQHQQPFGYIR